MPLSVSERTRAASRRRARETARAYRPYSRSRSRNTVNGSGFPDQPIVQPRTDAAVTRIAPDRFEGLCGREADQFSVPPLEKTPRLRSGRGFSRRLQAMGYSTGSHSIFHHRYHIVWAPKYRFKVLRGEVRLRVRDIITQVCAEMGVTIVNGALSQDHVHMFVEIPPHIAVSDFVRMAKGRSSRKIQQEFEHIRKRYWGQRFWARGTSLQPAATSQTTSS
jgi:putative transposase